MGIPQIDLAYTRLKLRAKHVTEVRVCRIPQYTGTVSRSANIRPT